MPTPPRTLGPAPSILLVRLSSLRDVLHGLPVLCALRRHFPAARITWVVEEPFAAVLDGHAALDRVVRVSRGWLKSPSAVLRLRRELASELFDVALDLQGLTKSAFAARLSGAAWRIGVAGRSGRALSKWFNNDLVPVRAWHVIDHYLALLRPLGIHDADVEFGLPVWPRAAREINRFLRDRGLLAGGFALVHPGDDSPSQQWPPAHYAALARHLGANLGMPTVAAWLDMTQRTLARTIVEETDGWGRLAPATSVHELAELTRRASLVVGSDTASLHLAVAAGTPSISLHGPTRASRTGAYGPGNVRLQAFHDERALGRRHRRNHVGNRALRALSSETVYAACARLLPSNRAFQAPSRAAA
jgi:heptosyltransferase I